MRSDVIKQALAADVAPEIMHARQPAQRIKTFGGMLPGSLASARNQTYLPPPKDTTNGIGEEAHRREFIGFLKDYTR